MKLKEFIESILPDGQLVGTAEAALNLPFGTIQAFADGKQRLFLRELSLILTYCDAAIARKEAPSAR